MRGLIEIVGGVTLLILFLVAFWYFIVRKWGRQDDDNGLRRALHGAAVFFRLLAFLLGFAALIFVYFTRLTYLLWVLLTVPTIIGLWAFALILDVVRLIFQDVTEMREELRARRQRP